MSLLEFLTKFNITMNQFQKCHLSWEKLECIKKDYEVFNSDFQIIIDYLTSILKKSKNINYIKNRIKEDDHLIAKIVRKNIEGKNINLKNYKEQITDLIGIRILHLFKDDWKEIHKFITENFPLHENPICYVRSGDILQKDQKKIEEEYRNDFDGLEIKNHPEGYRSIHYVVSFTHTKKTYFIEIQVRTIFEEGWSEIDHIFRYPSNKNTDIISPYLMLFNRLAGQADEMSALLKRLDQKDKEHKSIIAELENKIKKLKISKTQKGLIQKDLKILKKQDFSTIAPGTISLHSSQLSDLYFDNGSISNGIFLRPPGTGSVTDFKI
jgi:ppGpp synthetase/RelA/SpoT-type nucleotidyltranferase